MDLAIYDVGGRLVKKLVETELPAGTHGAQWAETDPGGQQLHPGVHFYRLRAGTYICTRRMLLIE